MRTHGGSRGAATASTLSASTSGSDLTPLAPFADPPRKPNSLISFMCEDQKEGEFMLEDHACSFMKTIHVANYLDWEGLLAFFFCKR